MVNRIFYSDSKLCSFEIIQRWYEIIEYIEKLYEENKHFPIGEELICLGIFESWYACTYLPDSQVRYIILAELDYYQEKWKHFVCEAIDNFYDSPSACWLVGFTSKTCNNRYPALKRLGEDMLKRGLSLSNLNLPFDILSGKRRKDKNDEYYIMPKELFPSNSAADKFFREMLSDAGIE